MEPSTWNPSRAKGPRYESGFRFRRTMLIPPRFSRRTVMHRRISLLLAALIALGLGACSDLLGPLEPQNSAPQPAHAAKYVPSPPRATSPSAAYEDEVPQPSVHRRTTNRPVHPAPPPAAVANLPSGNSNEESGANSKPSLTLDGEDDSRASAEVLLYKVD